MQQKEKQCSRLPTRIGSSLQQMRTLFLLFGVTLFSVCFIGFLRFVLQCSFFSWEAVSLVARNIHVLIAGVCFGYNERVTHFSAFTQKRMFYNHCCKGGKIHLPVYKPWLAALNRLVRFGGGSDRRGLCG